MDYKRYPANWKQISLAIRERDLNMCKFCGVPNGAVGWRLPNGNFHEYQPGYDESVPTDWKPLKVVLTVAHLGTPHADGSPGNKHDKMDCRDENLAALCQRCHLRHDIDEHVQNAHATRRRKKLAAGQLEMWT